MASHLYEMLQRRDAEFPDAVAVGGQEDLAWKVLSSRTMLNLVNRLAIELGEAGVREGDRVVLWAPNQWRTPVYLFALWKLGAIAVPFDREMNPEAGARILDSIEPRLILAGYGEQPAWSGDHELTAWWPPGSKSQPDSLENSWAQPAEELAAIFFTSGTTGDPKGCMITHANLCSQTEALAYTIPLDTSCRLASILPLSHLFELTVGLLYPLSAGAAVHYIPSRRGADILRVLSEQRITHMVAVPQLLALMGRALDDQLQARLPVPIYRLLNCLAQRLPLTARRRLFWMVHQKIGGQLRMMASGGAALPAETQELWERIGVRIVQGYGASECSPVIACGAGDGSTPIGSVGRPLLGVDVKLSVEGEVLAHGPNVMRGYWRDPERTAEVLSDGWYVTGDLATIDAEANITLSGRAKDLIVLPSGMNVWPQDVEDALRADPEVRDASVIAVPTTSGGAMLHAYLVPVRASHSDEEIGPIIARCNGRLAQHQRIGSASWWPESDFPRTAIGKVRRNLLPQPSAAGAVKVDPALSADDPVGQAIAGVARVSRVQDAQTLAELGLDSFGLVELATELEEKTGRALTDADLSTDMRVEDVRALVSNAPEGGGDASGIRGDETLSPEQPIWPYTWGRVFHGLSLPFDLLYRAMVTRTNVIGGRRLADLPPRVIFAGTHHSFADLPLIRFGIAHTPARRLARRLVVATASSEFEKAGPLANYGRLAFGLYPLRQRGERDTSLRGLARLANAGNAVLIFPQGVHAKPERERQGDPAVRFRPGIGHLAAALDATVIPFGLAGTERLMPPVREEFGGRVVAGVPVSISRGPLAIAFGEPMRLGENEDAQAFAERLQAASFALAWQAEQSIAPKGNGSDGRR